MDNVLRCTEKTSFFLVLYETKVFHHQRTSASLEAEQEDGVKMRSRYIISPSATSQRTRKIIGYLEHIRIAMAKEELKFRLEVGLTDQG